MSRNNHITGPVTVGYDVLVGSRGIIEGVPRSSSESVWPVPILAFFRPYPCEYFPSLLSTLPYTYNLSAYYTPAHLVCLKTLCLLKNVPWKLCCIMLSTSLSYFNSSIYLFFVSLSLYAAQFCEFEIYVY